MTNDQEELRKYKNDPHYNNFMYLNEGTNRMTNTTAISSNLKPSFDNNILADDPFGRFSRSPLHQRTPSYPSNFALNTLSILTPLKMTRPPLLDKQSVNLK